MTQDPTSSGAGADTGGPSTLDLSNRCVGGSYMLVEPIGQGATGRVWLGVDRASGEQVAVKVLYEGLLHQPKLVSRFVQERTILLMLRHRHVVRVRDLFSVGETLALVMDLVPGGSLRDHLREHRTVPPAEAARLAAQVAGALAEAHELGVVHRDLKPDNVLLENVDGRLDTRLTDFGIARMLTTPRLTLPHAVVGTPHYMAPESFQGVPAGPAADVYALGVLIYEMLAGHPPYEGDSVPELMQQHLEGRPERLPGMPDPLWDVIRSCLRPNPRRRPAAAALAARLGALGTAAPAPSRALPAAATPASGAAASLPAPGALTPRPAAAATSATGAVGHMSASGSVAPTPAVAATLTGPAYAIGAATAVSAGPASANGGVPAPPAAPAPAGAQGVSGDPAMSAGLAGPGPSPADPVSPGLSPSAVPVGPLPSAVPVGSGPLPSAVPVGFAQVLAPAVPAPRGRRRAVVSTNRRWARPVVVVVLVVGGALVAAGLGATASRLGHTDGPVGDTAIAVLPARPSVPAFSGRPVPARTSVPALPATGTVRAVTRPVEAAVTRSVRAPASTSGTVAPTSAAASSSAPARPVEAKPYGPPRCREEVRSAFPSPVTAQACFALGAGVQVQGALAGPMGGRASLWVSLVDADSARTVGSPLDCRRVRAADRGVRRSCGPATLNPPHGHRYVVVVSWEYRRHTGVVSGRCASDVFAW
ncbi:protein kinase domain-containing protein [Krasilnikovia sp. MM14-A1259]|uniref:serine/threonine-protein kinase n=1 Tax=Krasilnikovia sp. MM14-A1259 TaxID=3373539 RepID=UPI0037F688F2